MALNTPNVEYNHKIMQAIETMQEGKEGIFPYKLASDVALEFSITFDEAVEHVWRHIKKEIKSAAAQYSVKTLEQLHLRKGIKTRYLSPTDTKGARIRASSDSKVFHTQALDHRDIWENHYQAACNLAKSLDWGLPTAVSVYDEDYCWSFTSIEYKGL